LCFIDYEPWLHAYGSTLLRTAPIEGRRYTLKLSRDPWFPKVPTAPGFPLQPSYIAIRSSAYVCGTGYALAAHPPNRPFTDFHQITGHQAIACLEPFPCRPTSPWHYAGGLGRRRELHPSAPIAAAPALLEACGYSVCLASGGDLMPVGVAPRHVLSDSMCVYSWRSVRRPLVATTENLGTDRRACERLSFRCGSEPAQNDCLTLYS